MKLRMFNPKAKSVISHILIYLTAGIFIICIVHYSVLIGKGSEFNPVLLKYNNSYYITVFYPRLAHGRFEKTYLFYTVIMEYDKYIIKNDRFLSLINVDINDPIVFTLFGYANDFTIFGRQVGFAHSSWGLLEGELQYLSITGPLEYDVKKGEEAIRRINGIYSIFNTAGNKFDQGKNNRDIFNAIKKWDLKCDFSRYED